MLRCHLFCSYKVSVIYVFFHGSYRIKKKKNIRNYINKDRYMATIHSAPKSKYLQNLHSPL